MGDEKSVMVGMSGGVDSAAAALLMQQQGFKVEGVTLHLYGENFGGGDARRVCDALGIPHTTLDRRDLFLNRVIEPFADEYTAGKTPNPCVVCNREVKFAVLAQHAQSRGITNIATGHYAKTARHGQSGRHLLLRAADIRKDQSYVLYRLPQEILKMLLLPLGDYTKGEIRAIALEAGLGLSQKADSQDICFVPDGTMPDFWKVSAPAGINPETLLTKTGVFWAGIAVCGIIPSGSGKACRD